MAIYDNPNNTRILTILLHDPLPKIRNGGRGVAVGGGWGLEKGAGEKNCFQQNLREKSSFHSPTGDATLVHMTSRWYYMN